MAMRYKYGIGPETEACANCEHFYQHYIWTRYGYESIAAGHCVYPRVKSRKIYDCYEYFEKERSK
jgi:recombinational DNA repair protein (RecF pathway)